MSSTIPPHTASQPPAIKKENLLDKMCFLVHGGGVSKYRFKFKQDMLEFHRFIDGEFITRPTISYWFDANISGTSSGKGSVPSRQPAFQFLQRFLNERVFYDNLSDDQRKVYAQVQVFLRNSIRSLATPEVAAATPSRGEKVYVTNSGNVVINIPGLSERTLGVAGSLVGIYKTFRIRLSEERRKPIAQEVLRVYRRHKDVLFEHWYRRDGQELEKFDGVVMSVGSSIWFLGAAQNQQDRLRIMQFPLHAFGNCRWGILSSDLSPHASHEPAACRVLLIKLSSEVVNYSKYVAENVSFVSPVEDGMAHSELIERLVRNNVTAISNIHSTTPVTSADGSTIVDSLLKINQTTLQEAAYVLGSEVS